MGDTEDVAVSCVRVSQWSITVMKLSGMYVGVRKGEPRTCHRLVFALYCVLVWLFILLKLAVYLEPVTRYDRFVPELLTNFAYGAITLFLFVLYTNAFRQRKCIDSIFRQWEVLLNERFRSLDCVERRYFLRVTTLLSGGCMMWSITGAVSHTMYLLVMYLKTGDAYSDFSPWLPGYSKAVVTSLDLLSLLIDTFCRMGGFMSLMTIVQFTFMLHQEFSAVDKDLNDLYLEMDHIQCSSCLKRPKQAWGSGKSIEAIRMIYVKVIHLLNVIDAYLGIIYMSGLMLSMFGLAGMLYFHANSNGTGGESSAVYIFRAYLILVVVSVHQCMMLVCGVIINTKV